jgi:hypothetical protein
MTHEELCKALLVERFGSPATQSAASQRSDGLRSGSSGASGRHVDDAARAAASDDSFRRAKAQHQEVRE